MRIFDFLPSPFVNNTYDYVVSPDPSPPYCQRSLWIAQNGGKSANKLSKPSFFVDNRLTFFVLENIEVLLMNNDAFIAVSFPEIIRWSLINKSVSLVNYREIFLDGIIIPLMTFNISSWFHAKLENWIGSNWTKTWSVLIGGQILIHILHCPICI